MQIKDKYKVSSGSTDPYQTVKDWLLHYLSITRGLERNQENRERLREERLGREAAAGPMLYPAPDLPDDTPVENVRFTTRIRKTLSAAGMKTIGDVREVSDAGLLSLPDFGSGSLSYLREALGLPSTDCVRPKIKKPT
jgi:DNA-directed RNA polymerase alpha subunit